MLWRLKLLYDFCLPNRTASVSERLDCCTTFPIRTIAHYSLPISFRGPYFRRATARLSRRRRTMNRSPDPCGRRRGLLVAKACKLCAANVRPALDRVQARRIVAELDARLAAHGTPRFLDSSSVESSRGSERSGMKPAIAGGKQTRRCRNSCAAVAHEKINNVLPRTVAERSFLFSVALRQLRGKFWAGTSMFRTEELVSRSLACCSLFLSLSA